MRVFVSSTYKDLIDHRRAVADALERLGLQFRRMETFGARPEDATRACLEEVEASELFVGIYAHRYGYVPTGTATSVTEAEFDHAHKNRRPTFCFLVDETYPWPEDLVEQDPGRSSLQNFKARIESLVVRDVFTTPDVLGSRVASSIGRYLIADPRRHGAPDAARFARLTLADAATAVFVDLMRLSCVAGGDLARDANQSRYAEFVDIADQHFSDFRTQVTRLADDPDLDTIKKCSDVERGVSWAIVLLRRSPTLDRTWREFVTVLRDLAERVDILADTVSKDYYRERARGAALVIQEVLQNVSPSTLENSADMFVKIRFKAQSAILAKMRAANEFVLGSIRDDMDRRLAIPYFVIDLELLRRAMPR
jgi:hypothetical protein